MAAAALGNGQVVDEIDPVIITSRVAEDMVLGSINGTATASDTGDDAVFGNNAMADVKTDHVEFTPDVKPIDSNNNNNSTNIIETGQEAIVGGVDTTMEVVPRSGASHSTNGVAAFTPTTTRRRQLDKDRDDEKMKEEENHREDKAVQCNSSNGDGGTGPGILLQDWKEMPRYLQFNPYVHTGYRPLQNVSECLGSLFYFHNETFNILTHGKWRRAVGGKE